MKISGFTMGRNVTKLYYPVKESIMSILPICDEFIVALGRGDADDRTREEIESIGSDKIRIVDTEWDFEKYPNGTEMAHQTDIAKSYCTGDWLFYIQADEVVHEKYLPAIKERCQQLLHNTEIEGLLFNYCHFWGDYDHVVDSHGWYKNEIRIIRNNPEIHSWRDAQSFRRIPNFKGLDYRQEKGTFKLKVAKVDAFIYHYGYVRPPVYMKTKNKEFLRLFVGNRIDTLTSRENKFDYGPLNMYPKFTGTHPPILNEWIARFNWKDDLQYSGKISKTRDKHKQERLKYRLVTFLEKRIFFRPLWEFENFIIVK